MSFRLLVKHQTNIQITVCYKPAIRLININTPQFSYAHYFISFSISIFFKFRVFVTKLPLQCLRFNQKCSNTRVLRVFSSGICLSFTKQQTQTGYIQPTWNLHSWACHSLLRPKQNKSAAHESNGKPLLSCQRIHLCDHYTCSRWFLGWKTLRVTYGHISPFGDTKNSWPFGI